MYEIALIEKDGKVVLDPSFDLKLLEDTLDLEIKNAQAITPTPENADECAKQVTKLNKTLKENLAKLATAQEPYLTAIEEASKPLADLLGKFASEVNDYKDETLKAKKESRKEKARGFYAKALGELMVEGSLDGEAPKFDDVYDQSYYNLTDEAVAKVLKENIKASMKKDDPSQVATFVFTGSAKIGQVEELLKKHGWVKDKDFKEEIL
jgi:hypothetical protein